MYHFTDGGLRNVWVKNGYVEKDTPYGKAVAFHDLDGLVRVVCLALANKPGKLSGAEFRYIRNSLLMSQKSLGQLMGYTEQAIAKWEKTGKVPKSADMLLRYQCISKYAGDTKVNAMIDAINILDRIANTKIIISENRKKWVSEYENIKLAA